MMLNTLMITFIYPHLEQTHDKLSLNAYRYVSIPLQTEIPCQVPPQC